MVLYGILYVRDVVCILVLAWSGEATIVPPRVALQPGADKPVRLVAFAWTARRSLRGILRTEERRPNM